MLEKLIKFKGIIKSKGHLANTDTQSILVNERKEDKLVKDFLDPNHERYTCPFCGGSVFYVGTLKDGTIVTLCENCMTEFNYTVGLRTFKIIDLDRINKLYGGLSILKEIKKNNINSYKFIIKNSDMIQRIKYFLLRGWYSELKKIGRKRNVKTNLNKI